MKEGDEKLEDVVDGAVELIHKLVPRYDITVSKSYRRSDDGIPKEVFPIDTVYCFSEETTYLVKGCIFEGLLEDLFAKKLMTVSSSVSHMLYKKKNGHCFTDDVEYGKIEARILNKKLSGIFSDHLEKEKIWIPGLDTLSFYLPPIPKEDRKFLQELQRE